MLPGASYLVRMLDGRIDVAGTIKDLTANGHLTEIVHDAAVEAETTKTEPQTPTVEQTADGAEASADKDQKKARQLVKEEARAEGSVKWAIYKTYITASSYIVWALVLFLIFCGQSLFVAERLWVRVWGKVCVGLFSHEHHSAHPCMSQAYDDPEAAMRAHAYSTTQGSVEYFASHAIHDFKSPMQTTGIEINLPSAHQHPLFYVAIFACITLGGSLVNVTTGAVQLWGAYRAGKQLFHRLLVAVIRAPFR